MIVSCEREHRIEPGSAHLIVGVEAACAGGAVHHHQGCELVWARAQPLAVRVSDRAVSLAAGELLLIGQGVAHALDAPPAPDLLVVHFLHDRSPLARTEAWQAVQALARQAQRGLRAAVVAPALSVALERLRCDGDLGSLASFLAVAHQLTAHAWEPILGEAAIDAPPVGAPAWMRALCARIDAQLTDALDVSALCRLGGVGRSALCAAFTRHCGCGPMSWVARRRLERAAELLLRSDRQVLTIARDSGFSCLSTFNRRFAARHGLPPARWRQLRGRSPASAGANAGA